MMKINVFDSFSGAGGFSLGFSMGGYELVGASEIDKWACETFSFNHPTSKVINGDITQLTNKDVLSNFHNTPINVLLGGPPCQGFSIANKRNGDPTDPRNSLFEEFIRLGKLFKPQVLVLENVPNIVKARTQQGKLVVEILKEECEKLGYYVYTALLQASDYGVPQTRRRFVLIASYKPLKTPFPEPTYVVNAGSLFGFSMCPTLWEAISDLPSLIAGEVAENYDKGPQNNYQRIMRNGSNKLHNHIAMKHTSRMVARFKSMTWGQKGDELTEEHLPLKRNGNGEKSEKGYSQNNRRMFPDKPCHTLPASFYANFVHPYDNRNFTPREGARIQSFPDTFVFKGKPTVISHKLLGREGRTSEQFLCQYSQIGNAVPPLMAQAIAENLKEQLFVGGTNVLRSRQQLKSETYTI